MTRSAVTLMSLFTLLAAGSAYAGRVEVDVLLGARKILVKDSADTLKRRVVVLSKDENLSITGLDPTVSGAEFFLVDPFPGQLSSTFSLPSSGWTSKNGKFKYKDRNLSNGPVKTALLKQGLLRVVLKGSAINFPVLGVAPLGEVGGVFTLPGPVTTRLCFLFPGTTGKVKKDDPVKGIYRAIKADAPFFCPEIIP
jgi:hypothetical protein